MKSSALPVYIWGPMLLLLMLFGSFEHQPEGSLTEIAVYEQVEMGCQLTVYSVGEPAFPFGPGSGRFVLEKDGSVLDALDFVLYNDGKQPDADNFAVSWEADGVRVTVSAEEQEDATYLLYYDGRSAIAP